MIPDIAQSRTAGSMPVAVDRACREQTSEQDLQPACRHGEAFHQSTLAQLA